MLKSMQEMFEYAYDVLNERFFDGELPPVVITLMSDKHSFAHFTVHPEWRLESDRLHEINLSVNYLSRPVGNLIASLCHEMVHYHCLLNNIQDTSKNGRYHNKRFKAEAEKRGLIISYAQYIGYSVTEPSQELLRIIEEAGITKPLDINRDGYMDIASIMGILGGMQGGATGTGTTTKPKCSTRKYLCKGCGSSFRATRDLEVLCIPCNKRYVKVEK